MKYWVNGQCHGGGWSHVIEAASPQEALAKAMDNEPTLDKVEPAYKIDVYPAMSPMPQDSAYANQLMGMPQPLLTVTRGPQPCPAWLLDALIV